MSNINDDKEVTDTLIKIQAETLAPQNGNPNCNHGVVYNSELAKNMTSHEIKKQYPRGYGLCPKGCGFSGIAYASYEHYIAGDW